jgi:hypothetical protein
MKKKNPNAKQNASLAKLSYDEICVNKRGVILVREDHAHGVFNTVVDLDGKIEPIGSGPADSIRGGPWLRLDEPCEQHVAALQREAERLAALLKDRQYDAMMIEKIAGHLQRINSLSKSSFGIF